MAREILTQRCLRWFRVHRIAPAAALLAVLVPCRTVGAVTVDFSGISSASVSSRGGQDFPYVVGSGSATGVLNVRLISGDISTLTTGADPDPTGFYILQIGALTPALFRFTFDRPRGVLIASNETLTGLETNTFSLAPGEGPWSVLSVSYASLENAGSEVTFVGLNNSPPYGHFLISAVASSFDFLVSNAPGFSVYGSAISLEVLDVATPSKSLGWGQLKNLYR